jgi:hypothetical protein
MISSVFYRMPSKRLSTQSTAKMNSSAFLTLELTCYKRYTTGPMDKMSGAYSGSMAKPARGNRPLHGPLPRDTVRRSALVPASFSQEVAEM